MSYHPSAQQTSFLSDAGDTGGLFDGVLDLDAALRDARDPSTLKAEYDSGDHPHPSDAGDAALAAVVDPGALQRIAEVPGSGLRHLGYRRRPPSKARSSMPTPGFPPHTLDDEGTPIWISELASDDPNHSLHVVRGLDPAQALEALGAKPRLFQTCELPDGKPDEWTSLPAAALGAEPGSSAVLVAGRIGEWTFVYDDSMATSHDETAALSADGRAAATSTYSINADASLTYFVDGQERAWINVDDLELPADLEDMPADLRAAFEAAGIAENDDLEPGDHDYSIAMRAACALAGLACTLDDLRRIPLVATEFG